ncbi:MAG: hypothetical protein QN183_07215 [Armatimonadota bacterium]|nr:hypothetical protein [Armatimonadota bacterium]MDR7536138.1 hypothetical protein [Armatimonadota bacterium]
MAFGVQDFHDLVRLLEQHPEWRAELRRLLLTEEILSLPQVVRELAEEVRRLAAAQRRTEERLEELAAAQRRTEERLKELAAAQRRTEERLEELAAAQRRTEETVQLLVRDVAGLKGESLERRYRERAASYFQRILRRIRVIDHQQLGLLLDEAVDSQRLGMEERADLLEADVVLAGVVEGEGVYLVAEVSGVITAQDVRRARRRAAVLEKATGRRTLPVVAGERLLEEDRETVEEAAGVWKVVDGRTEPPA